MRVTIDPWDPSYGTSADEAGTESEAAIDLTVETPARRLGGRRARPPDVVVPEVIQFVDGVRRVDARVWIEAVTASSPTTGSPATGASMTSMTSAEPALAASWAAGVVVCATDGRARRHSVRSRSGAGCSRPAPRPPTS